MILKFS